MLPRLPGKNFDHHRQSPAKRIARAPGFSRAAPPRQDPRPYDLVAIDYRRDKDYATAFPRETRRRLEPDRRGDHEKEGEAVDHQRPEGGDGGAALDLVVEARDQPDEEPSKQAPPRRHHHRMRKGRRTVADRIAARETFEREADAGQDHAARRVGASMCLW
jgi:hypothetical protein